MLEKKINDELKQALKEKDSVKLSVLRLLKSEIHNYLISKKLKEVKDEEIYTIIQKQIKRHMDSVEQFKKGNRSDLADKEAKELEILKVYMPEMLSEEKVRSVVKETIEELQAAGKKDFGKVMKAVMEKIKGRADGKMISSLVGELLAEK